MLQWMGGSRRKVTTSRKSTHNRQKQYFEQRKRQQQAPGLENYTDVRNKRAHYHEEPRSLDILSMINLAKGPQQGCSNQVNDISSGSEQGAGSPKNFSAVVSPQNVPVAYKSRGTLDEWKIPASSNGYTLDRAGIRPAEHKEEIENQVSVLDLLSDDGRQSNLERRSVPEAHVAFSVKGLGKVGMETPGHSPRQRDSGFSSPPKVPRRSVASLKSTPHDLGLELNAMMQDIRMSDIRSRSEQLCNSRGMLDDLGNMKRTKFMDSFISPDAYDNQIDDFNDDEENFYNCIEGRKEQQWDDRFVVLDDILIDERKYDATWKSRPFHTQSNPSIFSKAKLSETYDPGFQDPYSQNRRDVVNGHRRFDISAPSDSSSKHLKSEKQYDLVSFDWESYPGASESSEFESMFDPPAWSFLSTEDAQDNMSLLSEESCSSSAVRQERSNNFGSNLMKLSQSKINRKDEQQRSSDKFAADEAIYTGIDEVIQEKNLVGTGNSKSMPNKWRSRAGHCWEKPSVVQGNLEPECISVFKEAYTSVGVTSAPSSFPMTSTETDTRSFDCKLMSEDDLFNLFTVPKLYPTKDDSTHRRSKSSIPVNHEPSNNFICGESILRPISPPVVQLRKPATHPLETEVQFPYSSCATDFRKDIQFPDLSTTQNVCKDNTVKVDNHRIAEEAENEVCVENNALNSLSDRSAVVADCKNNCSEHEESKDAIQELFDSPEIRNSPEQAEGTPMAMEEALAKPESCMNDKLDHFDGGSQVLSPVSNKDSRRENSGADIRNVGSKRGSSTNTSYQVMLESYVLQLLCVQKVLMETSEKDIGKKV